MGRIIDYTILKSGDLEELSRLVNGHIVMGWQPFGSILYDSVGWTYVQPMVKYSKERS